MNSVSFFRMLEALISQLELATKEEGGKTAHVLGGVNVFVRPLWNQEGSNRN